DNLTISSISGFNQNVGTSAEDYNRLVPLKPFQPVATSLFGALPLILFPGGVVHDPQTGTSPFITSFDYGTTKSKEYTQELRLSSSYQGPFNFNVGVFYSEISSPRDAVNYYVESSTLTAFAQ